MSFFFFFLRGKFPLRRVRNYNAQQPTGTEIKPHIMRLLRGSKFSQNMCRPIPISHVRWLRPATNSIKLNWDAALDNRKKIMGMGIIARDHSGEVKAAMCDVIPYIRDPSIKYGSF
jgi:hypothetical protein